MKKELSIIKRAIVTNYINLFFGIIATILLIIGYAVWGAALIATDNNDAFTNIFAGGGLVLLAFMLIFGVGSFVIFIINLIFTIQAAVLQSPIRIADNSTAKTLIWIGFGLQFFFSIIGVILMLVGLYKQKTAFTLEVAETVVTEE
ncbi:hypothetical protein [Mycoplasma hafezii]|uniref:hypothetical protein n=1 Tax=Mycoplasma hafezii TaxID=525886 RepID=UPI003CE83672